MSDLIRLSAAELASRLAAGDVSSVEATQAHLDRIGALDGAGPAGLHRHAHRARAPPAAPDRPRPPGPRAGTSTRSAPSRPRPTSTAAAGRASRSASSPAFRSR